MAEEIEDDPSRARRLEAVRAEIERELVAGTTLHPADWTRRHPDLEPELGRIVEELLGRPSPPAGPARATIVVDPGVTRLNLPAPTVEGLQAPSTPGGGAATAIDPKAAREPGPSPPETTAGFAADPASADPAPAPPEGRPDGGTTDQGSDHDATVDAESGVPPGPGIRVRYVGDYEILGILGEGGMGVVYRARQMSLDRPVALKMIRNAEFASPEQIRRFQNEAEAVATLDHPGIVPIIEIGTYDNQRYFSMKLIDGKGLDKQLGGMASDPARAATIVAEVAEAIHHAHQRGILHRDLKPSNVLIDRQEHAHVTDFGLAKRIASDQDLTVTGAVMGTPGYMAPEQAMGRSAQVTTASDVYGLGAILFAALTRRAPFVGDSLLLTLDQVRNNPPEPPSRINPGVPRDLEVICLKCLEKDPTRRYGSAREVADDLRRWLDDEPIAARPVGPATRLRMWARRKPALAGLSLALAVALIVAVAGITWQWREAVYQRDQATIARDAARDSEKAARDAEGRAKASEKVAKDERAAAVAAKGEAEKNADLAGRQATIALATVRDLVERVNKGVNNRPDLYDLKEEIINQALKRVDAIDKAYQGADNKEATTLAALRELATFYRQTGQIEKASTTLKKALGIARARVVIKNGSDPSRENLAGVLRELAFCAEQLDRDMKAAIGYETQALSIYQDILDHPMRQDRVLDRRLVLVRLGELHFRLGNIQLNVGDLGPSLDEFRKAFNIHNDLLAGPQDEPVVLARLGLEDLILPNLLHQVGMDALAVGNGSYLLGRREAAEEAFARALEILERHDREPKSKFNKYNPKFDLADYHATVGLYRSRIGQREAARREYLAARDLLAPLVEADPKNFFLKRELIVTLSRLGRLEEVEGHPEPSRLAFVEAAKLAQKLYEIDERNALARIDMILLLPRVGQVDRAEGIADGIAAGPRVDNELWVNLSCCYAQCAKAQPPERAERAQTFRVKAVGAVEKAVLGGYRDRIALEVEPDLDPIRHLGEFQDLLGKIPPPPPPG